MTIVGDAGVGKTRLVRELWAWLGAGARAAPPHGACLSYGHGITYWPLGEVLKEHLGILDERPAGRGSERLGVARSSDSRSGSTPLPVFTR